MHEQFTQIIRINHGLVFLNSYGSHVFFPSSGTVDCIDLYLIQRFNEKQYHPLVPSVSIVWGFSAVR